MSPRKYKQQKEFIGRKRKGYILATKNFGKKKQFKFEECGMVDMTYKLDKNLFKYGKYIKLFGENFVESNKDKCKIIIAGQDYEMKCKINFEKFNIYDINEEDKILQVILKLGKIEDMSCMFYECKNLIKVDLSLFNTKNIKDMSGMFCNCENLKKN